MKALILRQNAVSTAAISQALADKGFQILCVDTLAAAHALIRMETVDLLVMDERVEGQLTHAIALSGERKNPYLSAIILTDRPGMECDDLYELIPSLYALIGAETVADLIGKLAISAVSSVDEIAVRIARQDEVEQEEEQAAQEAEAMFEEAANDALLLENAVLINPDDDGESGAPAYADVAIAAPELPQIATADTAVELEKVEDAVMAEVAALFRSHPLSHLAGRGQSAVARPQTI